MPHMDGGRGVVRQLGTIRPRHSGECDADHKDVPLHVAGPMASEEPSINWLVSSSVDSSEGSSDRLV